MNILILSSLNNDWLTLSGCYGLQSATIMFSDEPDNGIAANITLLSCLLIREVDDSRVVNHRLGVVVLVVSDRRVSFHVWLIISSQGAIFVELAWGSLVSSAELWVLVAKLLISLALLVLSVLGLRVCDSLVLVLGGEERSVVQILQIQASWSLSAENWMATSHKIERHVLKGWRLCQIDEINLHFNIIDLVSINYKI